MIYRMLLSSALFFAAGFSSLEAGAADSCLFTQPASSRNPHAQVLADGKTLRDRGVFTVRVTDVSSSESFETLNEEVKVAVADTLKKFRLPLKDFYKKQGLVEQYAAGKFTGDASGMYLIVTYSTDGAVNGNVFRLRSRRYSAVADVVKSAVRNCAVSR